MAWRLGAVIGILVVGLLLLAGCATPGQALALPTPSPVASAAPVLARVVTASVAPTATIAPLPTATPVPSATPMLTATPTLAPTPTIASLRSRVRLRAGDRVTQVTPGMLWISRETRDPLKINILIMDLTAPELDIKVGLGGGWLSGTARTSQMAQAAGAVAAVNGDLFNQFTLPEGLTIVDGKVAIAPKKRATFAWGKDRQPFIGYFTRKWTWDAEVQAPDGARTPLHLLNWPCPDDMLCLYNDLGRFAPYRAGGYKALIGPDGRVTGFAGEARGQVPQGGLILQGTGQAARWLQAHTGVGDRLELATRTDPPLSDFNQAVSGGPIIVQDGRFVEDCLCGLDECAAAEAAGYLCEDLSLEYKRTHYRQVYMPRTGVGFDKDRQTLITIVADGYQPGFSRGAQQRELARLFLEFGAHTAMELDGGGSSTMVVRNKVVNHPSDNVGERHVANSLLFLWHERRAP